MNKKITIAPKWMLSFIHVMLGAAATGLVNVLDRKFNPAWLVSVFGAVMSAWIIFTLFVACIVEGFMIAHIRKKAELPLSARFPFDREKGFHVSADGDALCPLCLNEEKFTRIRYSKTGVGYCPKHTTVCGPDK